MTDEQRKKIEARRQRQKVSRVFSMPDMADPGVLLSPAEITFFKTNGFLIKERLLAEDAMREAMARIWTHAETALPRREGSNWRLARNNPESWINPDWAPQPPHPTSGPFQGRQPREYVGSMVKLHDLGAERYMLDLMNDNPDVNVIARAFLGNRLRQSECIRGVYALFPQHDEGDPQGTRRVSGTSLGPHTDQVCQQLNACAYLEDVAARNGGFTVYPGSHQIMFRAHNFEANWSPTDNFGACIKRVIDEIEPWELTAPRGSVIFWHGRTVHSSGIHTGRDIRWAVFADFTQDRPVLDEDEHRAVLQYEWFKDAKLFRDDAPVHDDMWRHWAIG